MELIIVILLAMVVLELGWLRVRVDKLTKQLERTHPEKRDSST